MEAILQILRLKCCEKLTCKSANIRTTDLVNDFCSSRFLCSSNPGKHRESLNYSGLIIGQPTTTIIDDKI